VSRSTLNRVGLVLILKSTMKRKYIFPVVVFVICSVLTATAFAQELVFKLPSPLELKSKISTLEVSKNEVLGASVSIHLDKVNAVVCYLYAQSISCVKL